MRAAIARDVADRVTWTALLWSTSRAMTAGSVMRLTMESVAIIVVLIAVSRSLSSATLLTPGRTAFMLPSTSKSISSLVLLTARGATARGATAIMLLACTSMNAAGMMLLATEGISSFLVRAIGTMLAPGMVLLPMAEATVPIMDLYIVDGTRMMLCVARELV